jgi:alkylhydroperoxidase/carboxymuconolactone decarboxylase family protein YurZ
MSDYKNPFEVLNQEAPQVSLAFNGLIQAIASTQGLDGRTRQLIYIGIKASQGDAKAVVAHVPMAKKEGVSKEEILDAILISLTTSGVQGITNCLIPALEAYENEKERKM